MTSSPAPEEVGFERPDGYSEDEWEAYRAGAQAMLELSGSMLLGMAADVEKGGPGGGGGEDEGPPTCDDCGMELLDERQMGQEEPICPNCDLLPDNGDNDAL